jgi:predicted PolB exonuclease-like 3'-5' exonuclease
VIVALDIETIPNTAAVAQLPEPKAKRGLKDPAKIAADIADKKAALTDGAALDPLTGRVACLGLYGDADGHETGDVRIIEAAATDDDERAILEHAFAVLAGEDTRIVTWNGIGFDLPFIYKRALILGLDPAQFGVPPLTAWTKRYNTDRHFDLMQVWAGWSTEGREKLDVVASLVLRERKAEFDVNAIKDMLGSDEGRVKLAEYCQQDARLTWRLFKRMSGLLFA